MLKWTLIIVLSACAGAATALSTGESETALAFQAWVKSWVDPAPGNASVPAFDDYVVSFNVYNPTSFKEAFELDGKPDPTVRECLGDDTRSFFDVLQNHEHRATTKAVHCLLTHNVERFCRPGAKRLVAAASELYFWSRDFVFSNSDEAERKYRLAHLNDDMLNPEGEDLHFKTWDGPEDRLVFEDLKQLARAGYIDPATFSMSYRPQVRDAIATVKKEHSPCPEAQKP